MARKGHKPARKRRERSVTCKRCGKRMAVSLIAVHWRRQHGDNDDRN